MSVVLCLPAHLRVSTAASRGQAPHGNASTWSARQRRRLRQRRHVRLHHEKTAVPWRPPRRRNDPRNLPTADSLPPGGDPEGATGAGTMIVLAKTTVQLIAGPTAPQRGMMSHNRRDVPPGATHRRPRKGALGPRRPPGSPRCGDCPSRESGASPGVAPQQGCTYRPAFATPAGCSQRHLADQFM